jgi:hypothetical protein
MPEELRGRLDSRLGSAFGIVAGLVPLCAYIFSASGYAYWLDSGEFVAASLSLGVAHPPGHPLASILGHFACFFPFGPHSFRVAILSAVLASLASVFLYRTALLVITHVGGPSPFANHCLSLTGSLFASLSVGWWFQAIRPEVYALQAALLLFALERVTHYLVSERTESSDPRDLYAAGLALSFGLANHHLLAVLMTICFLPLGLPVIRERGGAFARRLIGFSFVGLLTYIYLPLRAWNNPAINLGDPDTPGRFFWVISAEVFQKNTGGGVPEPLEARAMDVLEVLGESLQWPTLCLALGGLYVGLRIPTSRRISSLFAILIGIFLAARIWLGFVRDNPDAHGYLMVPIAGIAIFAMVFLAFLLNQIVKRAPSMRRVSGPLGAGMVLVALAAQWPGHADLHEFRSTDIFDEELRRQLPENAVVLLHSPQTAFRFLGGELSEGLRPDVTVVPIPFLSYPGMAEDLVRRSPDLAPFLRGYLLEGEIRQADLQSLATNRTVLVEMDVRVPPAFYETLAPAGYYHQVLAGGAAGADAREGATTQRASFGRIYRSLEGLPRDTETDNRLLWRHYVNSLYYMGFGQRELAREEVELALHLSPASPELLAMRDILTDEEARGPIDITPFLPADAP